MKISIVTVCYNSVDTIEETMLSVLNQTYPDVEYIIIDGGSTDGTVDIIKKYADRLTYWVSAPDKGIYDAMNKGIVAASGDYINFLNSGDYFASKDVLAKIASLIKRDDILIYGDWNILFSDGSSHFRKSNNIDYFKCDMPFCHQAAFLKTDYIKNHLFDTRFHIKADYNLMYNVYSESADKINRCNVTVCYYDNSGISSKNFIKGYRENYKIWKDHSTTRRIKGELFLIRWKLKSIILNILPYSMKLRLQKKKLDVKNTINNG